MNRRLLPALCLIFCLMLGILPPARAGEEMISPLIRIRSSGDPCITFDPETGYYYALYSSSGSDRITLYRSQTLKGLGTAEGKDLYVAGDGCWEEKEIMSRLYAPEIHRVDGKWYIYASGGTVSQKKEGQDAASRSIRLFCLEALSDDPYGDYAFKGLLDDDLWAIDASVFSWNGKNYALCAEIVPGEGNVITIAELESPWKIRAGTARRIARAQLPFETQNGLVNEGPWFFQSPNGRCFILYSANNVSSPYYCLNLLEWTGEDLLSPEAWKKFPETTFVTTGTSYCPGHGSVFLSPDGTEYWLAYHVKSNRNGTGNRMLCAQPLRFDESGCPLLDFPLQSGDRIPPPSGEP